MQQQDSPREINYAKDTTIRKAFSEQGEMDDYHRKLFHSAEGPSTLSCLHLRRAFVAWTALLLLTYFIIGIDQARTRWLLPEAV